MFQFQKGFHLVGAFFDSFFLRNFLAFFCKKQTFKQSVCFCCCSLVALKNYFISKVTKIMTMENKKRTKQLKLHKPLEIRVHYSKWVAFGKVLGRIGFNLFNDVLRWNACSKLSKIGSTRF